MTEFIDAVRAALSDHPERPTHPDFIRLSEVVQAIDQEADDGSLVTEILGIDEDSLAYLLRARVATLSHLIEASGLNIGEDQILEMLWLDGFTVGKRYAEKELPSEVSPRHSRERGYVPRHRAL